MSVDDRIVTMEFDNAKFTAGVTSTLSGLDKLNAALKNAGKDNGLDNLEKSSNKVTFSGISNAWEKVKAKFGRGLPEADQAFSDIDKSSAKVTFQPLTAAIDKLKGQFNFGQAADTAFAEIERSSGRVTFSGLSRAISGVASQFSIIEGAASVALGSIVAKASLAGGSFAKSFTLGPITDGFHEYETQLNSVQTILANTQASGATLKDVGSALNDLNHYADQTIYNFTEMTRNIGTFTAAGVDLDTATQSIKGIANLAALSGSNSQQASTAMYQLSQAISAGKVGLQDWNSVVNAGMGGTVFQRALATTAENMGTLKDGAVALVGPMKNVKINGDSFRESITAKPGEKSWLTSDVLTNTLKQFTGDLTDAQLAAQGFSESQIKAIQKQAQTAKEAATQVKTLSGLIDTTKEAIGSGWAQTFQILFGNFNQARSLFTGLSNSISGFVSANSKARNNVLKDWVKLGGKKALFEGLKAAMEDLAAVAKPIKDAFRDIFPAQTGKSLADMSKSFRDFMESLKIGSGVADNIRGIFRGLFAVLDIGKQVIGGVFTALGHMFKGIGDGSGGVLKLGSNLGDLLTNLDKWLKEGDRLKNVFAKIGDVLAVPIHLIGQLADKINGLFDGKGIGDLGKTFDGLGTSLNPLSKLADLAKRAFDGLKGALSGLGDAISSVAPEVGKAFNSVVDAISNAFSNGDWSKVFAVIQTTLIGGIFIAIKKALGKGANIDLGGGALKNLGQSLGVLKNSLTDLQKNIQAHTLVTIAGAIALLAGSVVALSLVNPQKLGQAMTAIAVGLAELVGAMAILGKGLGGGSGGVFAKLMSNLNLPFVAASLILLAGAIDILTLSVLALSRLNWEELAKGLTGVGALLAAVSAATIPLSKGGPGMVAAGLGLIALAAGMILLAGAVKIFSTFSWAELGKGLAAVAGSLILIGAAANLIPPGSMLALGAGLILAGVGLNALAGGLKILSKFSWEEIGKGLAATAGLLIALGVAANFINPLAFLALGAGLIVAGIGLAEIAGALRLMGGMSWGEIAKGLVAMGGSLLVLAVGLTAMIAALPGAAALLLAAVGINALVPAITLMSKLSWGEIGKGLAAIAASMVVIGLAGAIAGPGLVLLGAGLIAIGLGVVTVGAGFYLIAQAVQVLATEGTKGVAVFIAAVTAFMAALPGIIINFLQGLVSVIQSIAELAPKVVTALASILTTVVAFIVAQAPQFAIAAIALITAFVNVLVAAAPQLISAGISIFMSFLHGVEQNIGEIVNTVANIITRFLNALTAKIPQISRAGADLIIALMDGIATQAPRIQAGAVAAAGKFISIIASEGGKLVARGAAWIASLISGLMGAIGRLPAIGTQAVGRFASGISSGLGRVVTAGTAAVARLIAAITIASIGLIAAGLRAMINFGSGLISGIGSVAASAGAAAVSIGVAIAQGVARGITSAAGAALSAAQGLASKALGIIKSVASIASPSKVTTQFGEYIALGLAKGIINETPTAVAAAAKMTVDLGQAIGDAAEVHGGPSTITEKIGRFVAKGFAKGIISGSQDDVRKAFQDLNQQLNTAISNARQTIQSETAKIASERKQKKPDLEAIKKAQEAVAQSELVLRQSLATRKVFNNALKDERSQLAGMAGDYEKLAEKLKDAKQALADATKERDDAITSYTSQFSDKPDIDPEAPDQLAAYSQAIINQTTAVQTYKDTLDQLRTLGLDDDTYKKLLEEGPADQAFASQLLAGGKTAIDALNGLDAQLDSVSKQLATNAAANLYQAGVDAKAGIVKGLLSDMSTLRKAMEKIADVMVTTLEEKLHINSPSRVFAEIGRYSVLGMAQGLTNSSKFVTDAASGIGEDAVMAMRDGMAHISEVLGNEIDVNPTITPILDLTEVQKGAKQLTGLTNVLPLSATASLGLASLVSTDQASSSDPANPDGVAPVLQFNQTNNSPKALSETEIYRQTSNQLSQAKSALGLK